MSQKIICPECHEHLQGTELPPDFKLCPRCIIKTTPQADISKLVDSTGHQYDAPKEPKPVRKKRETQMSIYTEIFTQQFPDEPQKKVFLMIKGEDYLTKKAVFQFATSYDSVKDWYEQMKEIDEEPASLEDHIPE